MTFVLPVTDLARIQELCEARVPPEKREHVRVEVEQERQAVNIVERRPPWREDYGPEWSRLPVARLRYVASKRLWTLYYHRHTGRWERYPLLGPSRRLADLGELAEDLICVFWGLTVPARCGDHPCRRDFCLPAAVRGRRRLRGAPAAAMLRKSAQGGSGPTARSVGPSGVGHRAAARPGDLRLSGLPTRETPQRRAHRALWHRPKR